jgi:hypothetical protein
MEEEVKNEEISAADKCHGTLKKKKPNQVSSGSRVDQVLPSCCTGRFFNKLEPVQPPDPGLTCRAGFNNCGLFNDME